MSTQWMMLALYQEAMRQGCYATAMAARKILEEGYGIKGTEPLGTGFSANVERDRSYDHLRENALDGLLRHECERRWHET